MRSIAIVLCCIGLVRAGSAGEPPPTLVVSIASNGATVVGMTEVADDELDAKFRELATAKKDRPIQIDADPSIERRRVESIVARAKAAGVTRVTIGRHAPAAPRPTPKKLRASP